MTELPSERLWYSWKTPHEKFGPLAAAMQERGMQRVLDLGCGGGRHLVFLVGQGFEMYGTDIDPHGLARARNWLEQEGLSAHLAVADMDDLPSPSGFFDAVVSTYVIHHNVVEGIVRTVAGVRAAAGRSARDATRWHRDQLLALRGSNPGPRSQLPDRVHPRPGGLRQ